jgi:hypothetical protein
MLLKKTLGGLIGCGEMLLKKTLGGLIGLAYWLIVLAEGLLVLGKRPSEGLLLRAYWYWEKDPRKAYCLLGKKTLGRLIVLGRLIGVNTTPRVPLAREHNAYAALRRCGLDLTLVRQVAR